MLYLAQAQQETPNAPMGLLLLAVQSPDQGWKLTTDRTRQTIELTDRTGISPNQLLLVELDSTQAIAHIEDAVDWVLDLVHNYLGTGLTPDELAQEATRLEQWKQSLTLQNQEISRRSLELELRRDQLQELEASLQQQAADSDTATAGDDDE